MVNHKNQRLSPKKRAKIEARLTGLPYKYKSTSQYGIKSTKEKEQKSLGPPCDSLKCSKSNTLKCSSLDENDRNFIFSKFWALKSWDAKKMYVISHVKKDIGFGKNRTNNRYYLSNSKNEMLPVCRTLFLSTLAIGEKTLQGWIRHCSHGLIVENQSQNTSKKIKKDTFLLNAFMTSVEKLPSHYARANTTKLYVAEKFKSLRELFDSYTEYCLDKHTVPCSRSTFEKFLYSSNLKLFIPKKDQCNKCVMYNNKVLDKSEFDKHIAKKEAAKAEKIKDKNRALNNEITMITNDAQATKHCPHTEANVMYYHLKINVHNNTIFNVANKECKNYFYTEMDTSSCASTFISCISDFLCKKCCNSNIKEIIIWCDNCTHQNKNVVLSNALLQICVRFNVVITLKFLEVGHTFLECDSVHSLLERTAKNRNIYHPSDYVNLAKTARKNPMPYEAELMTYDFFLDFTIKEGQFFTSLRPPKVKNSPNHIKVNDFVAIKHDPNGKIHYKTDHNANWTELQTKPKIQPKKLVYPKLNSSVIKLDNTKYDHLQKIKKTLPEYVHDYYESLPHANKEKKQKTK